MWARYMILAFVTNGLSGFGIRVMQDMGLAESHGYLYLSFWYLTGLVVAILIFMAAPTKITPKEWAMGGVMGLFSASQWFLLVNAVGKGVPGFLVYPVAIGGSLSVVALIGLVVLRERLTVYGYLGVASGIAGLALLSTV